MEDKIVIIRAIKKNGLGTVSRIPSSVYSVSASLSRGGYVTGLTTSEEKTLEKEMSLEPGTLSKTSKFWKDYAFKITGDSDVSLNLNIAQDFVDYKLCTVFTSIANNEEEQNNIVHDFVIVDEEQKANKDLLRIRQHDNAILSYSKMNHKEMKDVLKLLGYKAQNMSAELAQTTLRGYIDEYPTKFNEVVNDPDYKTRLFIKELEIAKIINKNSTKYYYGDINNILGNTLEEVIDFMNDKGNNEVYTQLKKALAKEQK